MRHQVLLKQTGEPLAEGPPPREMGRGSGCLLYLLPGFGGAVGAAAVVGTVRGADAVVGTVLGLLLASPIWPLNTLFALSSVGQATPEEGSYIPASGLLVGQLIGAAISAAIWFHFVKSPGDRLDTAKRENDRRREKIQNSERQRGESCGLARTLEEDIKKRRAKILQDLTQGLSPKAGSGASKE